MLLAWRIGLPPRDSHNSPIGTARRKNHKFIKSKRNCDTYMTPHSSPHRETLHAIVGKLWAEWHRRQRLHKRRQSAQRGASTRPRDSPEQRTAAAASTAKPRRPVLHPDQCAKLPRRGRPSSDFHPGLSCSRSHCGARRPCAAIQHGRESLRSRIPGGASRKEWMRADQLSRVSIGVISLQFNPLPSFFSIKPRESGQKCGTGSLR